MRAAKRNDRVPRLPAAQGVDHGARDGNRAHPIHMDDGAAELSSSLAGEYGESASHLVLLRAMRLVPWSANPIIGWVGGFILRFSRVAGRGGDTRGATQMIVKERLAGKAICKT